VRWHTAKLEVCSCIFKKKIAENPSFQYALQMDREKQIANIFWVDAKMLTDYTYFGDVVSFETTFGTNKEGRPLEYLLGSIILGKLVLFLCMMRHLSLSNGYLRPF
jgi:zinc finger SWIM domain-containing protein 3